MRNKGSGSVIYILKLFGNHRKNELVVFILILQFFPTLDLQIWVCSSTYKWEQCSTNFHWLPNHLVIMKTLFWSRTCFLFDSNNCFEQRIIRSEIYFSHMWRHNQGMNCFNLSGVLSKRFFFYQFSQIVRNPFYVLLEIYLRTKSFLLLHTNNASPRQTCSLLTKNTRS